jgi:hypothetical protein
MFFEWLVYVKQSNTLIPAAITRLSLLRVTRGFEKQ